MASCLSFGPDLDDEQCAVAKKIIERAVQVGVNPRLAVAVAYRESRLRPDVGRGADGEIGMMQVMPSTGKALGFSVEDLKDPDRNIDAGLAVLKAGYEAEQQRAEREGRSVEPRLVVVDYNKGAGHPFWQGGKLPKVTKDYILELEKFGAFEEQPEDMGEPTLTEEDIAPPRPGELEVVEQAPLVESPESEESLQRDIDLARAGGAGVGAFTAGVQARAPRLTAGAPEIPVPAAQTAPITGGIELPGGAPGQRPPMGAMPEVPGQRMGGSGTFNWGKAFGLGDIEAGRATSMGGAPGSADELIKQRAAALQRLQGMAPAAGMIEDPTRGGMMVPQQTPYTGPRGPEGQIGGGKPPPVSPVTPKPAGALEEVTSLLRRFATTPLMRYALPIAGGALSGGEAVRAAQELRKDQPDYLTAGLSGAGALGGLLSMFPATAPAGIPLAVGAGLGQFARERARENEGLRFSPDVVPSNPMGDFGF